MKYLFLSALSLVLLSMGQHASAYSYLRGDCGRIIYNGCHVTFNFGDNLSSDDKQIIDLAFDRLTAFSDTSITTNDNGDSSYSVGNGQNEIYFDSSVPTAVCNTRYNTESCRMSEVDIRFGAPTWTTDRDSNHLPYDNSARSLLGTAIHEGGHCIGMGHVNTVYNIMGEEWDHVTRNTTSTYYGPGEDISDGLIDRYGKKSADDSHRDVGVTDFRYSGVDGA